MRQVHLVIRDDREDVAPIVSSLRDLLTASDLPTVDDPSDASFIIAIGGDGTVLSAAADAIRHDIPVCGINVGRVGYLAEYEVSEMADLVAAIASGGHTLREHGVVSVRTGSTTALAVNDVVLEKVISQRIIEVAVTVNGRPLATYRTDGIIVATPLGSTAYSLSAGGPVLDPTLDALVMTPIAPHSLLTRPLVLGPDAVVELTVAVDRPARINVDGRELCTVPPGARVTVAKGDRTVRFISLGRHPFPRAVREQFGLGHA